jgi:peptide/nickel transport system permease protein
LGLGAACALQGCLRTKSTGLFFVVVGLFVVVLPVVLAAISQVRGKTGFKAVTREDWMLRLAPGAVILIGGAVLALVSGSRPALIEPGLPVVIFVIVLSTWPYVARLIRGQVLSLREKEFVEAARSLGASDSRIIFRHILPNLVAPIIVYTTVVIPANILFEAALSFLGVGVQPPTASWGAMISDAVSTFSTAWWYMLFPGIALLLTVLAFNLVGDGLQDALNPKTGR